MPDVRLFSSSPYGTSEGREVIRPHLALTIDEEARGSGNPTHVGALDVRFDPFGPSVASKVVSE
jgi:hypothetical protein